MLSHGMLRGLVSFGIVAAVLVAACTEESFEPSDRRYASDDAGKGAGRDADVGDADEADAGGSAVRDAGPDDATPGDGSLPADDAGARIACKKVAHLGDSLTAYTVDALKDAYAAVSIDARIEAYGGRAINEYCCGDTKNGKQAAAEVVASGFEGCWVVALGTNDTANVANGATATRASRIDGMMKTIDPDAKVTVMWVNTYTTKTDGFWSNANMKLWNQALEDAKARWPNMQIFDWASIAATGSAPFSDGIHHTTEGYKVRNAAIAKAVSEL